MTSHRDWEYATKGDYHRNLDPDWSYTPTYLQKMAFVRKFLDSLPRDARILDAGCGEGVLVEEYAKKGYRIEGIDLNYESQYVRRGNILNMNLYVDNSFDVVLLLDVFEHLAFVEQPKVLSEIRRILRPDGVLIASIPNLAHLNSRFNFFLRGVLDRSDSEINHVGERPMKENIRLLQQAGFDIIGRKGITLTVPIVYRRIICRKPSWFRWLHDALQPFAIPSLSMLNIFIAKKKG
ncbi:MAG: class I SAM-dependent methyltransferase [candidate division WOR-3 bacterium]